MEIKLVSYLKTEELKGNPLRNRGWFYSSRIGNPWSDVH